MASQEFLASFAVEINEGGGSRLQEIELFPGVHQLIVYRQDGFLLIREQLLLIFHSGLQFP